MPKNPADLRQDYQRGNLDEALLPAEPVTLFREWFEAACASDILEPNAMTLATVDAEQQPWTRTVLLKAYDERGFVFYTNYDGAKAKHIAHNAKVAATIPWLAHERQVNITGTAEKISHAESLKYFMSRPRGNRIGAWVSQQSQVISSRQLLEAKLEEVKRKFAEGEVPLPSFWGGYRIVPGTIEFWQGRQNRLHDRFRYQRNKGEWIAQRLQP